MEAGKPKTKVLADPILGGDSQKTAASCTALFHGCGEIASLLALHEHQAHHEWPILMTLSILDYLPKASPPNTPRVSFTCELGGRAQTFILILSFQCCLLSDFCIIPLYHSSLTKYFYNQWGRSSLIFFF